MCYPFETYAFVPMLDQVEELESKGLLHGKGGVSNVAMYNAICCAVDRDQKVEIAGERGSGRMDKAHTDRRSEQVGRYQQADRDADIDPHGKRGGFRARAQEYGLA